MPRSPNAYGKGGSVAGLADLCNPVVIRNVGRSMLPAPTEIGWLFLWKLIGWQRRSKEVGPGRRLKAMVGEDDGRALERCKTAGSGWGVPEKVLQGGGGGVG